MQSKLTIDKHGTKRWRLPNGKFHREDGSTVEWKDGSKMWLINGEYHKENGAAVQYYDGEKEWYLNGIKYTEQEYKYKMRFKKLKQLLK